MSLNLHNTLLGLLHPITPFAETIYLWHRLLIIWLIPIWFIVIVLLGWGILQFNNNIILKSNLKITHHTSLELLWTLLPFIIVLIICFPSLILLYNHETQHDPFINVKIMGKQWFWKYEIHTNFLTKHFIANDTLNLLLHKTMKLEWQDQMHYSDIANLLIRYTLGKPLGNLIWEDENTLTPFINKIHFADNILKNSFFVYDINIWNSEFLLWKCVNSLNYNSYEEYYDSYFEKVNANLIHFRTLGIDNILILPTQCFIRFLITGYKVIHSFYIPALGFKGDGVPGRLLQLFCWIENEGLYFGGCYELCGAYHHQMPIILKAIKLF
jgi:heme/copper-type cytochrome/quinol oxidase subunit 2